MFLKFFNFLFLRSDSKRRNAKKHLLALYVFARAVDNQQKQHLFRTTTELIKKLVARGDVSSLHACWLRRLAVWLGYFGIEYSQYKRRDAVTLAR
jgi:hypothetical protein